MACPLRIIQRWAQAWSALDRADPEGSVLRFRALADDDIHFADPFNILRGWSAFEALIRHTMASVEAPAVAVQDVAHGDGAGFLLWTFTGAVAGRAVSIRGMSEVRANALGRIATHIDHWDAGAQVYERIPLLGGALRLVKRKFAVAL